MLAFGRISLATVFLLVVVIAQKLPIPSTKRSWIILIVAGVLNNAIPFYLISWGQQYISGSTAAIMLSFGPFVALVLSHFTTHDEKFSSYKILGVIFGFFGVFILLGGDIVSKNSDALLGQLAVLLATICYITSGLLIRKLGTINAVVCSTSMLLTATIAMIPFVSFSELFLDVKTVDVATLAIVYLAILPTAGASLIRVKLVQRVGIQFMSQVSYLIPIFAIFWTWLFLDEVPKMSALIALILIFSGLLIRKIKEKEKF